MTLTALKKRAVVLAAIAALAALAVPQIAGAATYSFNEGDIANGLGTTLGPDWLSVIKEPIPASDMWFEASRYDAEEDSTYLNLMVDGNGWGMMATDGWTLPATPVAYDTFYMQGNAGEPWFCNGFDVNNTTGSAKQITITSSAGEGTVDRVTVVTVPTGVSHVDLTDEGHVNIPDGWSMNITFSQMIGLGFNNFNGGAMSEYSSGEVEFTAHKFGGAKFLGNSYGLTALAKKDLRKAARAIKAAGYTSVAVRGYTARIGEGSVAFRTKLSTARAKAAKTYLASYLKTLGVSGVTISYKGYGSNNPVASNATYKGRQQNRRVEIWALAGSSPR